MAPLQFRVTPGWPRHRAQGRGRVLRDETRGKSKTCDAVDENERRGPFLPRRRRSSRWMNTVDEAHKNLPRPRPAEAGGA